MVGYSPPIGRWLCILTSQGHLVFLWSTFVPKKNRNIIVPYLWSYGNLPRCATSKTPLGFPLTWAECDTNTNCNWSSPPRPQIVTTKTTNCHHQYHRLSLQILQPPNQYFQDQNLKCMKFKSITETINLPNAIKKALSQFGCPLWYLLVGKARLYLRKQVEKTFTPFKGKNFIPSTAGHQIIYSYRTTVRELGWMTPHVLVRGHSSPEWDCLNISLWIPVKKFSVWYDQCWKKWNDHWSFHFSQHHQVTFNQLWHHESSQFWLTLQTPLKPRCTFKTPPQPWVDCWPVAS